MEIKKKQIGNVEYSFISLDQTMEFICDRCRRRKVAKKYAECSIGADSNKKRICNACYGAICATEEHK